jgi:hypothetical protein
MPTQLDDGTRVLTSDVVNTLLLRDNIVYLGNQLFGMRGNAYVISSADYGDDKVVVSCIGMASLLHKLEAELIEQDDGYVWSIASRFVAAANAKQGVHGDLVVEFVHDETAVSTAATSATTAARATCSPRFSSCAATASSSSSCTPASGRAGC